ncbi:hypothetical protein LY632_05760 [Erythrobacter sp. SDW2]|uniref:hypothetical protein n=1 Tax=Erythrobacter sp. SDW2 TaxID=2907154 RepID=UPI001F45FFDE|nr:hypothetical protein [Erythrobacter sp. SDW2]UIP07902.1 hypothetical protein LY632_05760 [Erythrobacter sp. SDW2]
MMTPYQKRVAAWIAVGLLALAVAYAIALAASAANGSYLVPAGTGEDVGLSRLWRSAAFFMRNGALATTVFAAFLTVVSVAVAKVTEVHSRQWEIAAISILCLTGIGAATMAMIEVSQPAVGDQTSPVVLLDYYGEFGPVSAEVSERWVNSFFGSLIGWFGGFLAAVLGISLMDKKGTLHDLVDRN